MNNLKSTNGMVSYEMQCHFCGGVVATHQPTRLA